MNLFLLVFCKCSFLTGKEKTYSIHSIGKIFCFYFKTVGQMCDQRACPEIVDDCTVILHNWSIYGEQ